MAADYEGVPVSEGHVARSLGFGSVAEYRAWLADGSPSGRCSDPRCDAVALWPDLGACKFCGGPVDVTRRGEAGG